MHITCPYATWWKSGRIEMSEQGNDGELTDNSKEALLKLGNTELSRPCKAKGLPHTGNKTDLVDSLQENMLGAGPVPPPFVLVTDMVAITIQMTALATQFGAPWRPGRTSLRPLRIILPPPFRC